jgi:hypothetical protein
LPADLDAIALVSLLGGLRLNEIGRLRVGCITWPQGSQLPVVSDDVLLERSDAVCQISVPVSKTNTAFTKPVHAIVG